MKMDTNKFCKYPFTTLEIINDKELAPRMNMLFHFMKIQKKIKYWMNYCR